MVQDLINPEKVNTKQKCNELAAEDDADSSEQEF